MSDSRPLAGGEIVMAKQIFGNAIDYSKVQVFWRGWTNLQPDHTAVTPNGNIYFNREDYKSDFSQNSLDGSWLIHELVHVWQHQTGQWVMLRGSFERTYAYGTLDPAKPYGDYLLEQQATIVEDYYRITHGLVARWGQGVMADYQKVIPFLPKPGK